MDCIIIKDLLSEYIDNECSVEDKKMIENHLATCDDCLYEYNILKEMTQKLSEVEEVELPDGFHREIMASIKQEKVNAKRKTRGLYRRYASIAAVFVVVASIAVIGGNIGQFSSMDESSDAPSEMFYETSDTMEETAEVEDTPSSSKTSDALPSSVAEESYEDELIMPVEEYDNSTMTAESGTDAEVVGYDSNDDMADVAMEEEAIEEAVIEEEPSADEAIEDRGAVDGATENTMDQEAAVDEKATDLTTERENAGDDIKQGFSQELIKVEIDHHQDESYRQINYVLVTIGIIIIIGLLVLIIFLIRKNNKYIK